jgi:hypothetical protein
MEKMPSPRLPLLADTYLMSMNADTPCQARYRRIGMDIFPIGKKTAASLNTALSHLVTAERKGKNWAAIPKTAGEKSNLLLVYLESSPLLDAQMAELFSGGEESEALYSELSRAVCEALEAQRATGSDLIRLFVLNKIDPARVQVELSDAFTAGQVIHGSAAWIEGARNRPPVTKGDAAFAPSPAQVMRGTRMIWERGASGYSDAPGCRLSEVFDLLIDGRPGAEASARHMLRLTVLRAGPLLTAVGHAAHRERTFRKHLDAWKGISKEGKNWLLRSASVLGIALKKVGYEKETYMEEPAFLVGRFLSLVDLLHAEYCREVRKDAPPQLLGNALIPTSVANTSKGLARMLQRIRPYQAWARKDGTALARWCCSEIGRIADALKDKLSQRRMSDPEQAQLLLGYLAWTEKREEGVNQ